MKTYKIDTFDDFLKVDDEHIDAVLRDFTKYVFFMRSLDQVGSVIKEIMIASGDVTEKDFDAYGNRIIQANGFVWKDDGKEELDSINLTLRSIDKDGNISDDAVLELKVTPEKSEGF